MKADNIVYLKFDTNKVPQFVEKADKEWILYGDNNLYPQELIGLFNRSAKHNAIVTGKSQYIVGNGLKPKDKNYNSEIKFKIWNNTFTEGKVDDLFYKSVLDFEIYNGFALQMIPTKKGDWKAYHIDFAKLRMDKDKESVWYSKDWTSRIQDEEKTDLTQYPLFNPEVKKESVLYFTNYRPKSGLDVYTYPDYIGAIAYIECDYQIANFHVNNLRHGFTGATIINFFNGEPTPEEQKKIEKKLKDKFAGTDNAGGIVLVFSDSQTKEPKIENILPSDFDKQFQILNETVQQEIFTGHKVVSPMLFGVKTASQLGGRTELIEAFELFQNTYINERRRKVLSIYNEFAEMAGVGELTVTPIEPITFSLSEAEIAASLSVNEKRMLIAAKYNLDIDLKEQENIITKNINSLSPLVANNVLSVMTKNEIRQMAGLPPIEGGDVLDEALPEVPIAACSHKFNDDEDIKVFSEYGVSEENFTIVKTRSVHRRRPSYFADAELKLTSEEAKVLSLIKSNPKIGINDLATALKIGSDEALNIVTTLLEKEVIEMKDTDYLPTKLGEKVLKQNRVVSLKSMYKYALSPYLKGQPAILPDDRTRPFCEKLLDLKRLYSRKDLDDISARLGYDVWTRRGGFYTNPKTKETTPFCRHIWQSVTVIER